MFVVQENASTFKGLDVRPGFAVDEEKSIVSSGFKVGDAFIVYELHGTLWTPNVVHKIGSDNEAEIALDLERALIEAGKLDPNDVGFDVDILY